MKRTLVFFMALFGICMLFTACRDSGENTLTMNGISINEFFDAIEAEDYSGAAAMLYPDGELSEDNLKQHFEDIEAEEKVDFQKGVKLKKFSNLNSRDNCSVDVELGIGFKKLTLHIEVLTDKNGSGINQCYVVK